CSRPWTSWRWPPRWGRPAVGLRQPCREMPDGVVAVLAGSGLAGPGADRSAVIRAHAALAVVKGATLAALELGDGVLGPAGRAEILTLALGTLRAPQLR